jgi:hypothetical protein
MRNEHPRRRSDLSIRAVEGEMIVLDRAANQVHQLNGTASFIWHWCDGQHAARDIANKLASSFDIDLDTARDAVIASLRRFEELGLLYHAPA